MTNTISFKHSGNTGDIIYAMAGMKHICEKLKMKADFYLWMDRKGTYYQGATHPLGEYIFTDYMYENLRPLLMVQPWINSVEKYEGQTIMIDLDLIRQRDVNMPYGHIARWYFYVFPDMACNLSLPWLELPNSDVDFSDTVIINRTQRYQNPHIAYSFLRNYNKLMFVGTKGEYDILAKQVPNMEFVQFSNFLQLAIAIKNCKVFIGNQSMCFGIAEALKAPRILEVCTFAPNVIPEGSGPGYDYLSQSAFEYYVKEIVNTESKPKQVSFDWSRSRFQQDSNGGWFCRKEDNDIIQNTLVDIPRLAKIEEYVKKTDSLPGVIAEIGVYKGGTALLIRRTSKKPLILIDTFEGMPEVDSEKDLHHTGDFSDTSLDHVHMLLTMSHGTGLSSNTNISKRKFTGNSDDITLFHDMYSFVHIDVDIYQSVKDCLEFFYPRMVTGGIICVDDYNEPNCPGAKQAFDDFMKDKPEGTGTTGSGSYAYEFNEFMDCQSQRAFIKL